MKTTTFKHKADIGDKVWFMRNDRIEEGKVSSVMYEKRKVMFGIKVRVLLCVYVWNMDRWYQEHDIFLSKEECAKSLIK